jgi:two-component system, chemotaxis family, chemotaxis protein CheY
MARSVVLVGHCGVDGPRLQSELSRLDGVEITRVNSTADLDRTVEQGADLLLVNREPVGFDEDGLAIVRHVKEVCPDAKVILVSDYEDVQTEAQKAGALPGFGKRLMGTPELGKRVQAAMGD